MCWGSFAFLIVDLTFHGQWHICRVPSRPTCSGSFAWLGSHPSLAARKGATVEVVLPTRHKCSFKLCLLFGSCGPTSLQQRQLGKNNNLIASHHAVVVFLGLEAILVLPLARVPLLKSYCQRATSVLPSCVCYLAHLGPHLYSKGSCEKITTFGTATRVEIMQCKTGEAAKL